MSMDSLFTLQTGTLPGGKAAASITGQSKSGSAQNLDFMALILSRLGQGLPLQTAKSAAPGENAAKTLETSLLAGNGDATASDNTLLEALSLNREALDSVLAPLTKGIITSAEVSNGSPRILKALLIDTGKPGPNLELQINKLKAELQKLMKSGDAVAISANLTPEQITALQNAKDGQWPDELKGMMIGLITLAPPRDPLAPEGATPGTSADDQDDMQNLLVMLVPAQTANNQNPAQDPNLSAGIAPAATTSANAPGKNSGAPGTAPDEQFSDFKSALQDLQTGNEYRKNSDLGATQGETKSAAASTAHSASPYGSALQNSWPLSAENNLYAAPMSGYPADSHLSAASGITAPGTHMAGLTGLITQAQNAGYTHPATQAVAVSLQKAAAQGENRTFVLEMDPPELGRVEVRLAFGRDKTVKTTVITEKSETYMMLQRDAHALERALENAGLDSGGSLSFEMAENGQDPGDANQRGGGHESGGAGTGNSGDGENTIISTMTWHVDPASGHMRYDILA